MIFVGDISCCLSIVSNTIANLNRYGVQPRMDSIYMNISGNSSGMPTPNRSPYYSSPPFIAPQPTSQPGETTEMVWNRTVYIHIMISFLASKLTIR